MKLIEIKMSVHRKFTVDYNSYGYRVGLMYDTEGANLKEAYLKITNELEKVILVENNKLKIQMESLPLVYKGNKCLKCGQDTSDKAFDVCKRCYMKTLK